MCPTQSTPITLSRPTSGTDGGHSDLGAERGFPGRYRQLYLHIALVQHVKQRMGSELDMKEQVASGRLACAGFALSRQAYDRTMAYPGRNGHIEGFWARHHTRATTRPAGLLLLHAAAVAGRAHGRGVECDRAGGSVVRLFEAECNGRLDVLTTHGKARARARAAPGAKQRRKKVAEAARAAPGTEEVTHIVDINAPAFPAGWGGVNSAPAFQFAPS